MLILGRIAAFFLGNIKWIAIIGLAMTLIGGFVKYTAMVKELERSRITIAQLENNIVEKEATIEFEKNKANVLQDLINSRDTELNQLRERLDGITDDLPSDSTDVAPESIRETLRRLNK